MPETEGVIKYRLDFQPETATSVDLEELNTWRDILFGLHLIGQDPDRYLGYGYGNLSMRDPLDPARFIISGTQTGMIEHLSPAHYVTIDRCDIERNHVMASGPVKPSSEALTHAMIYQLDPTSHCVLHIHDPLLWHHGLNHGWPTSSAEVEYGTTAMAREVERLFVSGGLAQTGTLIMAGHEDGVVSFGHDVEQAGIRLLGLYADAHS